MKETFLCPLVEHKSAMLEQGSQETKSESKRLCSMCQARLTPSEMEGTNGDMYQSCEHVLCRICFSGMIWSYERPTCPVCGTLFLAAIFSRRRLPQQHRLLASRQVFRLYDVLYDKPIHDCCYVDMILGYGHSNVPTGDDTIVQTLHLQTAKEQVKAKDEFSRIGIEGVAELVCDLYDKRKSDLVRRR